MNLITKASLIATSDMNGVPMRYISLSAAAVMQWES